ncbi:MAG TPA: ABC transporter permease, partial [Thermoanaerobaculia bacterium]
MTTPSDAVPELPVQSQEVTPATMPETRPLYWSVRRELWENRSIYIGPLLVAAFVLFGFALSTIGMPHRRRAISALDEAAQRVAIEKPYDFAAGILAVTAFMIGFFYCLDALYGERRDRSILFWKSLPVSDRTTVLAKASIPLVVLPAITLAIALITHLVMMLLSTAILLLSDFDIKTLLPQLRFVPSPFVVIYSFVVIALWHAP